MQNEKLKMTIDNAYHEQAEKQGAHTVQELTQAIHDAILREMCVCNKHDYIKHLGNVNGLYCSNCGASKGKEE